MVTHFTSEAWAMDGTVAGRAGTEATSGGAVLAGDMAGMAGAGGATGSTRASRMAPTTEAEVAAGFITVRQ